jgi:penicillin-binding protein 2
MNREDGHYTRGAAAVAVEIGTGDILALASYPTYNLATFRQEISELSTDESKPMWNRATSGTYPPGSTLKPATAIAALQEGKVGLHETLYCDGHWEYPNSIYGTYCWRHSGCGLLTITSAIRESCTFFFADMGYRLGMDKLREYFSAFGLGQSTGIEISESTGRLPENPEGEDQAPWAGYGQSNQLYTPLQLANYIATLVDGGTRYPAHLLKSVKTYDNSQVIYSEEEQEPLSTLDIDQDNLDAVLEGMRELAAQGSVSSYFKNCVVTAGAKTGTAQLGSGITNNGVFVCFAPFEDPQIALAVVIEQGGSGAALASTAVKILNAYFTEDEIGTVTLGEGQLLQ